MANWFVVTADVRADFELVAARVHGSRHNSHSQSVTFYVFNILQFGHHDPRDQPRAARREVIDDLHLAARSSAAAQPTIWVGGGTAIYEAIRAIGHKGLSPNARAPPTGLVARGSASKPSTRSRKNAGGRLAPVNTGPAKRPKSGRTW